MKLLTLLLLACASKAPVPTAAPAEAAPAEAAPAAALKDNLLPTPFTAEQLRAAMPVGTLMRFRLEAEGQMPAEQRWQVTAADAETCTIASAIYDLSSGALLVDEGAETSTWAELRDHAAFPAGLTTQTSEEIEVPAGRLSVAGYHVRQPDGPMRHFWFSPALPGPPVKMSVVAPNGTELMSMALIERTPR